MIRELQEEDIETVLTIWKEENVKAHDFITASYWYSQIGMMKRALPQSEVYVYLDSKNNIAGFIGLAGEYIAGLFVTHKKQSDGIGKQLLDYVKTQKSKLTLKAYEKNQRAIDFYQREGFVTKEVNVDEETGEKEFVMFWKK
ncbi:GNAT family N-acetyltransferase [Tetragenococcus halophilus]|uniref:Acetyltransferase n=1 Tax=Tetragenococcus halophilus (strain DSM 20338 / JCM 20259 / NCIMB 9735 / NBRC 12172) TaxID=945021 RepID=A0AAN1VQW8_TETHN|nr:GNAT family N-acetyltransferase [Tetragenococcus halophilus]NRR75159.1 GNAT family N-acetyltransferase [Tetragenococcus halophilus]NWO00542.1 GNAT family N-acetyltransferase [Tetragenococcus halophilus]QXN86099.1 GNAT family N-acetyltransferase [Tetragenococcus halophilus]RQD32512.1 GNAT family N-acetyltransferase [Tetragenococcus halophilus subsp. halophilus DSM 20339]BAK94428.1 putative acetyltransferase [Tetragenococcus halophilus NBRC 12172]